MCFQQPSLLRSANLDSSDVTYAQASQQISARARSDTPTNQVLMHEVLNFKSALGEHFDEAELQDDRDEERLVSDYLTTDMWEELVGAAGLDRSVIDSILLCEFPTGEFNAEARSTRNGTLCLLNHCCPN